MRDSKALTDLSEDIDTTLSEQQKAAARAVVCAHAVGDTLGEQIADATELMYALGVFPGQSLDDHLTAAGFVRMS